MADMIQTKENPIKAMVVISGNPLISVGNSKRLKEAFSELEFLMVIDIYPNATAERADCVLPANDMYEPEDIIMSGDGMQHQPLVQYTNRIVPATDEPRPAGRPLGQM